MMLDPIVASTRRRVEAAKARVPLDALREKTQAMKGAEPFRFERAIKETAGVALIAEVKKASPSKGVIARDFPYLAIARDYQAGGAAAISILTEPEFFLGSDRYLEEIRGEVTVPLLRKDFTIDPYQIYEAKALGADAVLLIAALLDNRALAESIALCDSLGLSALTEAHTEREVRSALEAGARVVGINNRDLNTFTVDLDTCIRLRSLVPAGILCVAESSIQGPADIRRLADAGMDAALIGETLMRSGDRVAELARLREASL